MLRFRIQERMLRFKRPFVTSRWTLTERRVLYLIAEEDETGLYGIGESAPLPQFGTESFEQAQALLLKIQNHTLPSPDAIDDITSMTDGIPEMSGAPTARFAMESALLDLLARKRGTPLRCLLNADCEAHGIPASAILGSETQDELQSRIQSIVSRGFSCVKIKVGAGSLEKDVERVRVVRESVGADMLIRLDANGAWTRDEALSALQAFKDFNIEYIEQPVPAEDVIDLAFLSQSSSIAIAVDETIRTEDDALRVLALDAADVLILKPMAIGSLLVCQRIAEAASAKGKGVVLTSLLDSAVGRTAVAQLAAALGDITQRHHGLATGELFENDVVDDEIIGGLLVLPDDAGLGIDLKAPA